MRACVRAWIDCPVFHAFHAFHCGGGGAPRSRRPAREPRPSRFRPRAVFVSEPFPIRVASTTRTSRRAPTACAGRLAGNRRPRRYLVDRRYRTGPRARLCQSSAAQDCEKRRTASEERGAAQDREKRRTREAIARLKAKGSPSLPLSFSLFPFFLFHTALTRSPSFSPSFSLSLTL